MRHLIKHWMQMDVPILSQSSTGAWWFPHAVFATHGGPELADEEHGLGVAMDEYAGNGWVGLHRIPAHLLPVQGVCNGVGLDKAGLLHGSNLHALAHSGEYGEPA